MIEITEEKLREIEEARSKATPGPWIRSGIREKLGQESCICVVAAKEAIAFLPIGSQQNDKYHASAFCDAAYIALMSPDLTEALVRELRMTRNSLKLAAEIIEIYVIRERKELQ